MVQRSPHDIDWELAPHCIINLEVIPNQTRDMFHLLLISQMCLFMVLIMMIMFMMIVNFWVEVTWPWHWDKILRFWANQNHRVVKWLIEPMGREKMCRRKIKCQHINNPWILDHGMMSCARNSYHLITASYHSYHDSHVWCMEWSVSEHQIFLQRTTWTKYKQRCFYSQAQ